MWIIIGITAYLFVGLVIGSVICITAGDDPADLDSLLPILTVGLIWPIVLIIILLLFLIRSIAIFVKALFEQFTNEKEESHG